jgi:Fe-S-cluster containining protein
MNSGCRNCKGACCETIFITGSGERHWDWDWLSMHGTMYYHGVELPCRCTKLDSDGQCSIWSVRPEKCRQYAVGGATCLMAIERRRFGEMKDKILDGIKKGEE